MSYLHDKATHLIKQKVTSALKKLNLPLIDVKVEHPNNLKHGDFAVNTALILAKQTHQNPVSLANQIVKLLNQDSDLKTYFSDINVAGPGFINFKLADSYLIAELETILKLDTKYGSQPVHTKKVLIDYSSPNVAKRFSVGHLRSTLIGQALANIFQFLGFQVIADNHLGDWGTQFGAIIAAIEKYQLDITKLTILDLEKIYVQFHKDMENQPQLKDLARQAFVRLEKGEANAKRIWEAAVKLSMQEFNLLYKKLQVLQFSPIFSPDIQNQNPIKYVAYGESFYEDIMPQIIQQAKVKGIAKQSQGALIVDFDGQMTPAILLKSDGTTTYLTRDLATVWFRENNPELKSDLYIYEVGAEQTLHFRQLFKIVEMLGWAPADKFVHVAHGLVRLPEGKMSTRKGRVINVDDLIDKIITKSRSLITNPDIPESDKDNLSQIIGIGALKYNELKRSPHINYVFNWQEALNLEGNSGPYLQYTYARCQSVLTKANFKPTSLSTNLTPNPEEEQILRLIYQLNHTLNSVITLYSPNLLSAFLFDLAQRFNTFYNNHPIIKAPSETRQFRLYLTAAVAIVIKTGLGLLGIQAPAKM